MIAIELAVPCAAWKRALPGHAALARRAARAAVRRAAPKLGAAEVSLVLADDRFVARLNRTWRRKRGPTNVLSFPCRSGDAHRAARREPEFLGDVVVAFETVAREAGRSDLPLANHFAHLVVHGVLHLFGHDHEKDAEARAMQALEAAALADLGIDDPYQQAENAP
jgi:probable rRNA maturation factor